MVERLSWPVNVEGKAMNQAFLRLLAGRLEQVPWVDVRLSATSMTSHVTPACIRLSTI